MSYDHKSLYKDATSNFDKLIALTILYFLRISVNLTDTGLTNEILCLWILR